MSDDDNLTLLNELIRVIPIVRFIEVNCPQGCTGEDARHSLEFAIIHLNDDHKWPREEIADWLETLDVDLTIEGASA